MATETKYLLIPAAAALFGFRTPLACKRFCLRHGVPVRSVGKLRFVSPADLEALIAGERPLPANEPAVPAGVNESRVDAAAAKLMAGGRR